jgi:Flp pilus assembly protein TadD
MFRQVLDFDPEDPVALFGLGTALGTLDRHDEAAAMLAEAARVDGKNSAIYPLLGRALEHLGRVDEARDAYRRGVEVASRRGDLMPLRDLQARLALLGA